MESECREWAQLLLAGTDFGLCSHCSGRSFAGFCVVDDWEVEQQFIVAAQAQSGKAIVTQDRTGKSTTTHRATDLCLDRISAPIVPFPLPRTARQ